MSTTPSPCLAWCCDERAVGRDGAADDELDRARLEHEGLVVAGAVLGTGVGDELHAPRRGVVVRGLGRVADHEADRVPPGHREGVGVGVVLHEADELAQLLQREVGLHLVHGQGATGRGDVSRHGATLPEDEARCATVRRNIGHIAQSRGTHGRNRQQADRDLRRRAAPRRARGQPSSRHRPRHRAGPPRQARRGRRDHRLGARPLPRGDRLPGDGVPDPRDPAGFGRVGRPRGGRGPPRRRSPRCSRPTRSPASATCGRGSWPAPTPTSSG